MKGVHFYRTIVNLLLGVCMSALMLLTGDPMLDHEMRHMLFTGGVSRAGTGSPCIHQEVAVRQGVPRCGQVHAHHLR